MLSHNMITSEFGRRFIATSSAASLRTLSRGRSQQSIIETLQAHVANRDLQVTN